MEELDFQALLDRLKPYDMTQWERVLIGHTGTVQLLLSAFFGLANEVQVQRQTEDEVQIERYVHLVIPQHHLVVCRAHSYIPLSRNTPEVLQAVRERKLGLGQIAISQMIPTSRKLQEIKVEDDLIERTYEMAGSGLYYRITESFSRSLMTLWTEGKHEHQ